MKPKLDNYRIFYEVAQLNSFSKAAEKLFVSQSAISQSIKQLEIDLDCILFHRHHKKTSLTQEGKMLYDHVQTALNSIDIAEQRISNLKSLDDGNLTIGAADTITTNLLLPYLEQFHNQYPNIHLQVLNATSLEMTNLIKSGDIDLAFVNLPIDEPTLQIHPCIDIHDIFVASSSRKLKKSYTRKELAKLPLILLEGHSISKQYVLTEFLKSGITLQPHIESGAHELLLQFAKINLGISCVIEEFSLEYLENKSLQKLNLIDALPKRAIGYIYQKDFPLSTAATAFIDLVDKG